MTFDARTGESKTIPGAPVVVEPVNPTSGDGGGAFTARSARPFENHAAIQCCRDSRDAADSARVRRRIRNDDRRHRTGLGLFVAIAVLFVVGTSP